MFHQIPKPANAYAKRLIALIGVGPAFSRPKSPPRPKKPVRLKYTSIFGGLPTGVPCLYFALMMRTDPLTIAKLLDVRAIDYCTILDVTPEWARVLARDPRHSRRVLLAVIEAAAQKLRLEEAIAGGPR